MKVIWLFSLKIKTKFCICVKAASQCVLSYSKMQNVCSYLYRNTLKGPLCCKSEGISIWNCVVKHNVRSNDWHVCILSCNITSILLSSKARYDSNPKEFWRVITKNYIKAKCTLVKIFCEMYIFSIQFWHCRKTHINITSRKNPTTIKVQVMKWIGSCKSNLISDQVTVASLAINR